MWRVELEGASADIDDIGRALPDGQPYQVLDEEGHRYLLGELLDAEETADAALLHAQRVVQTLNVASAVTDGADRPVRAGAVDDGEGRRFILAEADIALGPVRAFAVAVVRADQVAVNAALANPWAEQTADVIRKARSQPGIEAVDVFISAPIGFAVALGWRLNAIGGVHIFHPEGNSGPYRHVWTLQDS